MINSGTKLSDFYYRFNPMTIVLGASLLGHVLSIATGISSALEVTALSWWMLPLAGCGLIIQATVIFWTKSFLRFVYCLVLSVAIFVKRHEIV